MTDVFENVSVGKIANIFFDGQCVSHTIYFANGVRKTCGVIMPNSQLTFNVGVAEIMEIVSGICEVKIAGDHAFKSFGAGTQFNVPENSHFEIKSGSEAVHYVCSFES